MSTTATATPNATVPTNPSALIESLDADAIRERLEDLDNERKALLVLLRVAQTRHGQRERGETHRA